MLKDKIRWIDVKAIVCFLVASPVAMINKKKNDDLWLLSERRGEARDNGYWMFRYIKENYPTQNACYVIDKNSEDKKKIEKYGSVIDFGSFKHYVYYLMASKHVSAHVDSDSPNSRVSNFLETHGFLKNKRIFLQHGITKDKISFGYYNVSRADLFVCGAIPEYEFCKKEFGYPAGAVQMLGFARFDGLENSVSKRQILLMPTWRAWLANVDKRQFLESGYCKTYQELLQNKEFHKLLSENDLKLIFYPHSEMQKFVSVFKSDSINIKIAAADEYDIQTLLNESLMLITDYSSVAFDMAYMNKPVVYFQFDYKKYREGQHPEGYFNYFRDGFGPVVRSIDDLMKIVKLNLNHNFKNSIECGRRVNDFFGIRDKNNCYRIFKAIEEVK